MLLLVVVEIACA